MKAWYKDIGAHVKAGELLAVIDTPELDQQIAQARADLGRGRGGGETCPAARRSAGKACCRWMRYPARMSRKSDEDLAAKTGQGRRRRRRNLDRLAGDEGLRQYHRALRRRGDGAQRRYRRPGQRAAIHSGAEPLFAVADTHALRLYVNVPQSYSAQIVPGMTVTLTVPEYPGRVFPAKLVSTSGAIASSSSTLLVEFEAANPGGLLKPGEFAQVSMGMPGGGQALRLPASALLFRSEGLRVATLGPNDRVVLKPVTIGTDMGTQVVVASGLSPRDRVVNNPPDSLASGDKVRVGHARCG